MTGANHSVRYFQSDNYKWMFELFCIHIDIKQIYVYLYPPAPGYGDMGFNMTAYVCGIGSNFTQALYLLLVQRHSEQHMSVVETLHLNSFNTLPLLATAALVNGELFSVHDYPRLSDPWFCLAFFMSISVGMLLNYSLFLCTSLTSALTTSVVGGLKALVQTVLGILTFGGVSNNWSTFIGISMNLSGGISYILVRYHENKSKIVGLKKVMSFSNSSNGHAQNGDRSIYQNERDMTSHRSKSLSTCDESDTES